MIQLYFFLSLIASLLMGYKISLYVVERQYSNAAKKLEDNSRESVLKLAEKLRQERRDAERLLQTRR